MGDPYESEKKPFPRSDLLIIYTATVTSEKNIGSPVNGTVYHMLVCVKIGVFRYITLIYRTSQWKS